MRQTDLIQRAWANSGKVYGYDVDLSSLSVGMEKRLSSGDTSIGLALGYATGSASAYQDLSEIDAEGFSLTAFTRTRFGEGGLVQALFGYQDLSYDSSRSVMGETATGSTGGSQIFAALKVENLKDIGSFKFGPTASVEYYNVSTDSFTETGAGIWNLDVGEQSSDTFLATVGVSGEYRFQGADSENRLTGSIACTKASGDDLVIQSGFVSLPSAMDGWMKIWSMSVSDLTVYCHHLRQTKLRSKLVIAGPSARNTKAMGCTWG